MNIDPVTYEYYYEYYKKNNRFLDGQYNNPEKDLNDKQIKTKYNKYVKRFEKKLSKENSEYVQNIFSAEEEARKLDPEADIFWSSLSKEQYDIVKKEMKKIKDFSIIDPCHIISRGTCTKLADNIDNILMAPRVFHSYIDQYLNPFSEKHEAITKEQQESIWRCIVGDERYNTLLNLKRGQ